MEKDRENRREVELYVENARETLEAAKSTWTMISMCRALIVPTMPLSMPPMRFLPRLAKREVNTAVLSVFRQRFIKTGELPVELSEIYEDLIESRQRGDYDLYTTIEPETARQFLEKARQFVDEVEQWLRRNQWL